MAGIFDTHCHLMNEEYKKYDIGDIIKDAEVNGVTTINNVGYDLASSERAIQQSLEFQNVYATVGIHPTDVASHSSEDLKRLSDLCNNEKVIAIGEIGLDYYHKNVSPELQKKWFVKQLHIAKSYNLPVVIHCRDAYEDCYEILVNEKITNGIMHCYCGTLEMAHKFIDLGFYISFAGNITFKSATTIQEVAREIPLNKILVETDGPFLTPMPNRGKLNFPKHIMYTVKKIAELKKIPVNEVIRTTEKNANRVFGLDK